MEWYYDNLREPLEDAPEWLEIERVYCLDFDRFNAGDWERLAQLYNKLPQRKPDSPAGCPWWFGTNEELEPFLWASVEPPGLQVYGVLDPKDWEMWDCNFRALSAKLPKRVLR